MRLTPFEVAQPCSEIETARPRKLIRVSAALSVVPLTLSILFPRIHALPFTP